MRTTVTLDPDVENLLRKAMRERGISFKQALNEAILGGLSGAPQRRTRRYQQKTFRLGAQQDFRWDKGWPWPMPSRTRRSAGSCRCANDSRRRRN